MTHWTEDQYQAHLARQQALSSAPDTPDPGPESRLASRISRWAKERHYPCLNLRQSPKAKGFLPPGWPDVTLALPKGRTVYLELKGEKGRLSSEQNTMRLALLFNRHEWHEVRSFGRFLEIVERRP